MGHEKTLTALFPALAGANVIYGLGNTETGILMDYGQMVMDDEFAAMIKFAVQGIPVNDETLAVDVIHQVGTSRNYLNNLHTMHNMHAHHSYPELIDRRTRGKWEADGGTTIYERAWEKANKILASHQPEPLADEVQEKIRTIITAAEAELGIR